MDDAIATFIRECVPKLNLCQTRNTSLKWIDTYPLPKLQEISPPQMNRILRLQVSKEVLSHGVFLKKLQVLSINDARQVIHML